MAFPEEPLATLEEGHWLYEAFTRDYGYVALEHMAANLRFMLSGSMDADKLLNSLAESTAQSMQAEGIIGEYEIRNGSADYTGRLCIIGVDLKKEAILKELGM